MFVDRLTTWSSWDLVYSLTHWKEVKRDIEVAQTEFSDMQESMVYWVPLFFLPALSHLNPQRQTMHPDTAVEAAYIQRPAVSEALEAMTEVISGERRESLFCLDASAAIAVIDLLDEVGVPRQLHPFAVMTMLPPSCCVLSKTRNEYT